MSKRNDELKQLQAECERRGETLTATHVVDQARQKKKYPALHAHLWGINHATLLQEARLARAYDLIIRIKVINQEGAAVREMVNVRPILGYHSLDKVIHSPDLAQVKLLQLSEDISRAQHRLECFRGALPRPAADKINKGLSMAKEALAAAMRGNAKRKKAA